MDIATYLDHNKNIKEFFENRKIESIGISSGINEVNLLQSPSNGKKAILKKALPYFKQEPQEPLSQQRILFESNALKLFEELTPGYTPKIYFKDEQNFLFVMEYLQECTILNRAIQEGKYLPQLAKDIAYFLSTSAFLTSSFCKSFSSRQKLIEYYKKNEMKELSSGYIFDTLLEMFTVAHQVNTIKISPLSEDSIYNKNELLVKTKELKEIFHKQNESLIHGDFKGGALLVNRNKTFVIDFEFSSFGPMGYDVGSIFHLFVCMAINYDITNTDNLYKKWLLDNMEIIWNKYKYNFIELYKMENKYHDIGYIEKYLESVLQQSIGFLGIHMLSMSISLVIPIQASILDTKEELEFQYFKRVYDIAKIFILKYHKFNSIEKVIKTISAHFKN
ncbi:MAG: phosphotransferase [Campylobacterota bacterium]